MYASLIDVMSAAAAGSGRSSMSMLSAAVATSVSSSCGDAEPVEGMPRYSPRVIARTDLGPVVVADVHTTSPLGGREMQSTTRACARP